MILIIHGIFSICLVAVEILSEWMPLPVTLTCESCVVNDNKCWGLMTLKSRRQLFINVHNSWTVNSAYIWSRDHFLARFRDILAFFFARNRIKIPGVRKKKSHAEFFSFRAVKFLFCTCGSFRDYRTVLFDRFLNYCGAKIHYTYNCR